MYYEIVGSQANSSIPDCLFKLLAMNTPVFSLLFLCMFTSLHAFVFSKFAEILGLSLDSKEKQGLEATKNMYPLYCKEEVMNQKSHGTCVQGVMKKLRWNCDRENADRICCFNR